MEEKLSGDYLFDTGYLYTQRYRAAHGRQMRRARHAL
jgi:hypothetical protein